MINVIDIYNSVRDLCNKDQKGFVTPEVFSTFAAIAQQNVFNEMFSELGVANKARRAGIDPARDKSLYKMIEEDLSYFITQRILNESVALLEEGLEGGELYDPTTDFIGVFNKPLDLGKMISLRTNDRSNTPLELIFNSEISERVMNSNLSSPTQEFPVALISNKIEILPQEVSSVIIKYYRQPRSINIITSEIDYNSTPVYIEMSMTSDVTVPDINNSRHFELPEHYKNELIVEIAKLIGIRLRDSFLSAFANAEEQAE